MTGVCTSLLTDYLPASPLLQNAICALYEPAKYTLYTSLALFSLDKIRAAMPRWGESNSEALGRAALHSKKIQRLYQKDVDQQLREFNSDTQENWKPFGDPIMEIPDEGWSTEQCEALIKRYDAITQEQLNDHQFSGTIYSPDITIDKVERAESKTDTEGVSELETVANKLHKIFITAFAHSYKWNALHSNEFGVANVIDFQVVQMVSHMFGGTPEETTGFVTSGGTESLMIAARSYRNWGIKELGHAPGQSVIIAPSSVHAAILKAGLAYNIKIVLVDTDPKTDTVDLKKLEKTVQKHGNKVVAIVGSTPSYPLGTVDPIAEMAAIAKKAGCGMHVDACLGGFVINNLVEHETNYLSIPGVTSLSADTHKNGLAPKGSSTIVTRPLANGKSLIYYSVYPIPGWSGGIYGTPTDSGSRSAVQSLNAFLAMLAIGKNGYQAVAQAIQEKRVQIHEILNSFNTQLSVVGTPSVNVIAFKFNKNTNLGKGAIYHLAHEMSQRRITLNAIRGNIVHFCITARSVNNEQLAEQFQSALAESLQATIQYAKKGNKFAGDAGIYGTLGSALNPKKDELSATKYAQYFLLGQHAADDALRNYFISKNNPYTQH